MPRARVRRIVVLVLSLMLVAACAEQPETALEEAEDEGDAAELVGQTLRVSGEVTEALSLNAFELNGEHFGFGEPVPDEGTLVVSANEVEVEEGGRAQVTGEVVSFVVADIEEELGIDLDDELFADFEDQFAIVATNIEFVPAETPEAAEQFVVGEDVTVSGDAVEIFSDTTFTMAIAEDETEMLVVSRDPVVDLVEDAAVQVDGTVRTFLVADFEEEFGGVYDGAFFMHYEDEPAIVADSVTVVPEPE